eukprot:358715-Chlamydomonas_euryale.AAC.2
MGCKAMGQTNWHVGKAMGRKAIGQTHWHVGKAMGRKAIGRQTGIWVRPWAKTRGAITSAANLMGTKPRGT